MKPETTLKELLKPPFYCINNTIYEGKERFVEYCPKNDIKTNILKKDFLVAALNEKWGRDVDEPLRWIIQNSNDGCPAKCPNCKKNVYAWYYNYCPSCGVRLLPPGEDGEL